MRQIARLERNEYPSYSQTYMDLVKSDSDILTELQESFREIRTLIRFRRRSSWSAA